MPRGPKGEKRPGDVIGAAVMVGKIATGETEDGPTVESGKDPAAVSLGREVALRAEKPGLKSCPLIDRIKLREPIHLDFPPEQPGVVSRMVRLHLDNFGYSPRGTGEDRARQR